MDCPTNVCELMYGYCYSYTYSLPHWPQSLTVIHDDVTWLMACKWLLVDIMVMINLGGKVCDSVCASQIK